MKPRFTRKIFILCLTICIAFLVISAETLIAGEHDHDCTGEDCPVCLHIEAVQCFLKTFSLTGFAVFFAAFHVFFSQDSRIYNESSCNILSPIRLKVRLNS